MTEKESAEKPDERVDLERMSRELVANEEVVVTIKQMKEVINGLLDEIVNMGNDLDPRYVLGWTSHLESLKEQLGELDDDVEIAYSIAESPFQKGESAARHKLRDRLKEVVAI